MWWELSKKHFAEEAWSAHTDIYMNIFLSAIILFALPTLASAHTRWFMAEEVPVYTISEPTEIYLLIIAALVLVTTLAAIWLHQTKHCSLRFLKPKQPHAYERAASTFTMVIGSFLLIAGTHEYLFSPNLSHASGVPSYLIIIQIVVGVAFLVGVLTRLSACLLILVWLWAVYSAGWLAMLENIWVLSTAAFIMIMGNDYFSPISFSFLRNRIKKYQTSALSILRIGTGATFVILGLSEKILAPEYGLYFLSQYHWNFMQAFGFNYSNYLFTLSAGSVEILIGLIFILGVVTRLNAIIAIAVFTVPLFILGPIELAGHLPHFAAMFLLLFFGNDGHFSRVSQRHGKKVSPLACLGRS